MGPGPLGGRRQRHRHGRARRGPPPRPGELGAAGHF
jgi:hypothetical protein